MLATLMPLIVLLSWLALPVGLLCVYDDWVASPRRQLQAPGEVKPPPQSLSYFRSYFWQGAYLLLPVLLAAAVLRLLVAESVDFSALLLAVTAASGLVWLLDSRVLRPRRIALARAAGKDPALIAKPNTVDYARSFFPVVLAVLVLRSFVFEPYRIPSDSMMPTLLDGDFIIVNKFAYGLRLPVLNIKFLSLGNPQRGEVLVFRSPTEPKILIKRLLGLPGDHVQVRDNRVWINGRLVPLAQTGTYGGLGHFSGAPVAREGLGQHPHEVLLADELPASDFDAIVPPKAYFFMGDNRNDSEDSRFPQVGFVPEQNLVGPAQLIWMSWRLPQWPVWARFGQRIR